MESPVKLADILCEWPPPPPAPPDEVFVTLGCDWLGQLSTPPPLLPAGCE